MREIKKQTQANIIMAIMYQIISAVCSLILPRYILLSFGSDVNGMIQSVSQMLSYTMIMEFGVGGLITASFYKPLALGNKEAVSDIFNNTKSYFNKISVVFIGFLFVLALFAKTIIKSDFDFWYVCTMVLILGANYYFNYYFALAHRLLMRADQKIRIIQGVQCITLVLNVIVCLAAIKIGLGIHWVKLVSSLVFLINPIIFRLYVKKHYEISSEVYDENISLPRKSDGVVHHIAFFIHMNTDIVLLSMICGTKEVSVYSVYNSVIYAIENFFSAISDSVSATLGKLIAKDETAQLKDSFEIYQIINTAAATFVCVVESVLIMPFVGIYTSGITDVNYIRPEFAYLMIAAQWFYCMRLPYNNVINSAGHYRQTKAGAYIEVVLNLGISISAVFRWGLIGVAVGTATAMMIRTVYMAWYLSKNILFRSLGRFVKDTVLNITFGFALIVVINSLIKIAASNLIVWAIYAIGVSIIAAVAILCFNLALNRRAVMSFAKNIKIGMQK